MNEKAYMSGVVVRQVVNVGASATTTVVKTGVSILSSFIRGLAASAPAQPTRTIKRRK